MAIQIGDKAPNFTLRNSETNEVSLENFKGKNVVLLFFPLAFTATCTTELCSMRDDIGTYNGLYAEVLAISVDSPFVLAKYKEEQNLNFTMLSDFNKQVSRAYGALYEDFVLGLRGVSKRSTFVIDKEGTIKHIEVLEDARELPDFGQVKSALESLS